MNWHVRNSLPIGNMTDAIMSALKALVFTCDASISLSNIRRPLSALVTKEANQQEFTSSAFVVCAYAWITTEN